MKQIDDLSHYELQCLRKLKSWQKEMLHSQGFLKKWGKKIQDKINLLIPGNIHSRITILVKKIVETVLFASELIKPDIVTGQTLEWRENEIKKRLELYRTTAAAEGGITGWGGFLTALADFPALLAIKLKFLFDVASIYGYDTKKLGERVFLLHVFKLAFSSPTGRKDTYLTLESWAKDSFNMPQDKNAMDWYRFQQDYRDYLDIAKLLQMIPMVGAAVGIVVNYQLLNTLCETAMMSYRMRWFYDRQATSAGQV